MASSLSATHVFSGPDKGVLNHVSLSHADGLVTKISEERPARSGPRTMIIPALINAHDHLRPSLSSFGASNMPLESWIARSALATPPDPYLAAAVSFGRSARAGCAAMMAHYTRPSGKMAMVDEARAIARAAGDVGIRLAFAPAIRDQNPIIYGESEALLASLPQATRAEVEALFIRPARPAREYISLVDEIAAAIAGPMVDVQYGPAGVQWCSPGLLEAIAEASARTGRRVHMHLLETVYQRAWADATYPQGILRYLSDIGLLSERLTLAHCVHATPAELDQIAASGATIVSNFSSNLHLHSGLAPIASAHRRGCRIAMGVDGLALDEDDDALREMRLIQLAHDGIGFQRGWGRQDYLGLITRNGRRSTGAPGKGELVPGEAADFIVLDYEKLDRDAILTVNPLDMLFARGNMSHIQKTVVAGREICVDGKLTGLDLGAMEAELRIQFRKEMPQYRRFEAHWQPYEVALAGWFRNLCGCG